MVFDTISGSSNTHLSAALHFHPNDWSGADKLGWYIPNRWMTNPLCLSFPDGYTFSTIFDSEVVSTIYRIHPWVGRIACVLLVGSIGFAPLLSKNSMLVYYRRQFPLEITIKSHQVLTKTLPNLQKGAFCLFKTLLSPRPPGRCRRPKAAERWAVPATARCLCRTYQDHGWPRINNHGKIRKLLGGTMNHLRCLSL